MNVQSQDARVRLHRLDVPSWTTSRRGLVCFCADRDGRPGKTVALASPFLVSFLRLPFSTSISVFSLVYPLVLLKRILLLYLKRVKRINLIFKNFYSTFILDS